jgi:hypothetical protein
LSSGVADGVADAAADASGDDVGCGVVAGGDDVVAGAGLAADPHATTRRPTTNVVARCESEGRI